MLFRGTYFLFSYFLWIVLPTGGIDVNLSVSIIKWWSCLKVCFQGWLFQHFLVINVTDWVQLVKSLSCILSSLASQSYLLQSVYVKLIHQFLYRINFHSFFSYIVKVVQEEKTEIKKEIAEVLLQASGCRKKTGK